MELNNIKEYYNNIIEYFRILFMNKQRRDWYKQNRKYTNCLYCGNELKNRRRKFCSGTCSSKYWSGVYIGNIKRNKPRLILNEEDKPTKEDLLKEDAHKIAFSKVKFDKNTKCMLCRRKNVELNRHHEDYNQAEIVMILCLKCHGFITKYNHLKELMFNRLKGGKM